METIYEIIKIKQVRIEIENELMQRLLKPADVTQIANYFIGDMIEKFF
jgi:hypothetical protein